MPRRKQAGPGRASPPAGRSCIIPSVLYAEIHSPDPPIPNLLNNKLPEIIADAPHRLDRGRTLPILVFVKDAHLYPLELVSVAAEITQAGAKIKDAELWNGVLPLAQRFWSRIYFVDPGARGRIEIDVLITLRRGDEVFVVRNHAYKAVEKSPLSVYVSADDLPDGGRIRYGDLHAHSCYTDDAVEFGAPIEAMARMAEAEGLSFFAVTDHSYDLDDGLDPPSKSDRSLPKWTRFLAECASLETKGMAVVPGIEVSAGSARGRNLHLLILDPRRFYHGRGDSGDAWLRTRPDESAAEILGRLDPRELALAAHPFQKIRFLERLLLRRGSWRLEDIGRPGLAGLQIFNGRTGAELETGLKRWAEILLRGGRKYIYAGTDAHGGFNRSIDVEFPHLRLRQSRDQAFGVMKTGIYADETVGHAGLISRLRDGRCFATTGPSLFFSLHDERRTYLPGDEAPARGTALALDIKSLPEYGKIECVTIIRGDPASRTEREHTVRPDAFEYSFRGNLPFGEGLRGGYVRITGASERGIAVSNPIWIAD
jgi:hypothetical protein